MSKRHIAVSVWGLGGGAFANVARTLARGFIALGADVDILHLNANNTTDRLDVPSTATVIP